MRTSRILHVGAGHLGAEAQRHAFVGLDAQQQHVRAAACRPEQQVRRLLELDRHLGDAARQALARAQEERRARPAPVVDCSRTAA
jgi:hypothetical protein